MRTFLHSLLGTLAAIIIIVLVVGGTAAVMANKKDPIEDRSWLLVELQSDIPEYDPPGGIMSKITGEDGETVTRVLENMRKARFDDRIEGVILKVAVGNSTGAGAAQEIRGAIKRLQQGGKKVYGYAESFDASDYYILSACDEIMAPETAYINFTGIAVNSLHVKNALDKLGITANVHKIKDYKAAAEMVTRADMSDPARQNREWIVSDQWNFKMRDLQADRGFDETKVVEMMEHALFTASEAKQAGLIDEMMYWDQLEEKLKAEDDEKLLTVSQARYAQVETSTLDLDGDRTIAIIHAQGTIAGRKSGVNPLLGVTMGHETIVEELRRAREDEDVAAIIFRVDSGGGDALGSDLMGHEVEITAAEKPIVVSMVNVAASGGYHIAYRASKIVADEATITGSIGSINGKFNVRPMWEKAGVTHDELSRGPNALIDSPWYDFTPEQRARFEEDHWEGFNMWLRDVAEHRGFAFEEAEKLAHGRVWTGHQAKENGLIDEVGDLEVAVQLAKGLAEIPADDEVTRTHYPKTKGLLESLLSGDMATAARWAVYRAIREDIAETWSLVQNPAVLNAALEE
jgi:protease-4